MSIPLQSMYVDKALQEKVSSKRKACLLRHRRARYFHRQGSLRETLGFEPSWMESVPLSGFRSHSFPVNALLAQGELGEVMKSTDVAIQQHTQ